MNVAYLRRRVGRWALNGAAAFALLYILVPMIFVTWLAFFRPRAYQRWIASARDAVV